MSFLLRILGGRRRGCRRWVFSKNLYSKRRSRVIVSRKELFTHRKSVPGTKTLSVGLLYRERLN